MNTYRNIILLAVLLCTSVVLLAFNKHPKHSIAKVKAIAFNVKLNVAPEVTLPEGFADSVKKAEHILSSILSSQEFKDALCSRSFPDSSFTTLKLDCFERIYDENGKVSGKGVYENMTRNPNIQIEWVIKNDAKKAIGVSFFCVNKITSYDHWIKNNQYLTLRMVKHWAHEYTHICGYRHDGKVKEQFKWTRKEDPSYVMQDIVADIMLNWGKKGLL